MDWRKVRAWKCGLHFVPLICVIVMLWGCDVIVRLPGTLPSAAEPATPSVSILGKTAVVPSQALGVLGTGALHAEINRARQDQGLAPLRLHPQLVQAAQRYADVLADAGRLAHQGIDGTTLRQRILATGYNYRTFNENLSAGYPSARSVVNGWLHSPGHRKNLLSGDVTEVGVGYARSNDPSDRYVHYWVMVGGASR